MVPNWSGFTFTDAQESNVSADVAEAEQAHIENILHTGRVQHRHHRGHEFQFRAVRQGRRAAGMVIGGQGQHAAVLRGAGGVAVLEHVAAAVDAGAFAVPHGEHAVVLGALE